MLFGLAKLQSNQKMLQKLNNISYLKNYHMLLENVSKSNYQQNVMITRAVTMLLTICNWQLFLEFTTFAKSTAKNTYSVMFLLM